MFCFFVWRPCFDSTLFNVFSWLCLANEFFWCFFVVVCFHLFSSDKMTLNCVEFRFMYYLFLLSSWMMIFWRKFLNLCMYLLVSDLTTKNQLSNVAQEKLSTCDFCLWIGVDWIWKQNNCLTTSWFYFIVWKDALLVVKTALIVTSFAFHPLLNT